MTTNTEVDAYEVVESAWPYDGPHDAYNVAQAALATSQLIRYLSNATMKRGTLQYAANAGAIIGHLSSAVARLPHLLNQLDDFVTRQAEDPSLYDDRRDRPGAHTAIEVSEVLRSVREPLGRLIDLLNEAAQLSDHLGND